MKLQFSNEIITKLLPLLAYALLCQAAYGNSSLGAGQWLLGGLHAGLLFGPGLLAHRELRQHFRIIFVCAVAAGTLAFQYHGWVLGAWLCLLAGLGLGRAMASEALFNRIADSLQVLLCFILLFFVVIPGSGLFQSVPDEDVTAILVAASYGGWAVAYLGTSFIERERSYSEPVTSVLFFLLCCVLALSVALLALAFPLRDYLITVLQVVAAGMGVLAVVWVLWNPSVGGGLSTVFFRHILDLSVPFDVWMKMMTELADQPLEPEEFWQEAMEALVHHTDLSGVSWPQGDATVMVGEDAKHATQLPLPEYSIYLHTGKAIMPTQSFSLWLLVRVALEFRLSKEREKRLTTEATMRSIHELGARTTHDIKNLLHAIVLLCKQGEKGDASFSAKKKEQLMLLAGRLEKTLDQLKGESMHATSGGMMDARAWWDSARRRHAHTSVHFTVLPEAEKLDFEIPADLFDRTLENLLNNALRKQGLEGDLTIDVELGSGPSLTVRDNGSSIPDAVASKLFDSPIPSGEGMGIGLYQLAVGASKLDYELHIGANNPGNVAIALEKTFESG